MGQQLDPERAANLAENPYAGQGAVMLDIGGDVGALIVHLPASFEGAEVEIEGTEAAHHHQPHDDDHGHSHDHDHDDDHPHSHSRQHVAVVGRPLGGTLAYTAVFPSLDAGRYTLSMRGEQVTVTAEVVGGEVTEVRWPAPPDE